MWIDQEDNIVLAQSRLTYSGAELNRIASLMEGTYADYRRVDPLLLAIQPGVPTAVLPARTDSLFPSDCAFELEITNTGASAMQIARAGLRLTGTPQPNLAAYRLVEFCSVIHRADYCGPSGFGAGGCTNYVVGLSLAERPAGSDFMATPVADKACPEITLTPGQSATFLFDVYSMSPFVYRAMPVLDVTTPKTRAMVTLPELAAVFSFASPSAFACYRLSGSTFTPWLTGAAAFDWDTYSKAGGYCL